MGDVENIQNTVNLVAGSKATIAAFVVGIVLGGVGVFFVMNERIQAYEQRLLFRDEQIQELSKVAPASAEAPVEVISSSGSQGAARAIGDALSAGGWSVEPAFADHLEGWGDHVTLALPDNADGEALRAAFDKARVPYTVRPLDGGDTPQVFLGAGP